MDLSYLWIPVTLAAAAAQTLRNATQRGLIETIGAFGAAQVRFLYGLPFALVFLAIVLWGTGEGIPSPTLRFGGYVAFSSIVQVLATALMLQAMRTQSFPVVTALVKTEPVQVALFGVLVNGDWLPISAWAAILTATLGVILSSGSKGLSEAGAKGFGARAVIAGIAAGAGFAITSIGFQAAIRELSTGSNLVRSTTTLVWSLGFQTAFLLLWLGIFDRTALIGTFRVWRSSLGVGFLGALASQFWFFGFALTAAANVRTLALVEVLMAYGLSKRFLSYGGGRQELIGLGLIVLGVGLLLAAH